jgi:murein DD-endopeptidase MepM/ murein hydrolase activator NlpD
MALTPRTALARAALVTAAAIGSLGLGTAGRAAGPPCLLPPVVAPIVDVFRDPCTYCRGNRGLELAPVAGSDVVAAAGGVVTFAGVVAGTRYVVLGHAGGLRTTYGRLAAIAVRLGALVRAGDVVGSSGTLLFFGLREGERYLDPAPLLGLVLRRPWLVPLDGRHRRPGPPARLVCRTDAPIQ